VRALKPCTLVVPPVGSLRSQPDDAPRVAPAQSDGWLLRLIARSGDREDANNLSEPLQTPTMRSAVRMSRNRPHSSRMSRSQFWAAHAQRAGARPATQRATHATLGD
jgi:hypothetical protein